MSTVKEFTVTGMSCGHCENAIKQELGEITGIESVEVSASSGELKVTLLDDAGVSDPQIIAAVEEAGYEAVVK